MAHEFITWCGNRIHVTEAGHGDPLLLVPGLGNNIEMWAPFMEQFPHRRQVDAPDATRPALPGVAGQRQSQRDARIAARQGRQFVAVDHILTRAR